YAKTLPKPTAMDPVVATSIDKEPVSIAGLNKMTISMEFTPQGFTLTILNSDTGAELFSASDPYPSWTWSGTHAPSFIYYGVTPGTTGSLYVRDLLSTRPSGTPASLFVGR